MFNRKIIPQPYNVPLFSEFLGVTASFGKMLIIKVLRFVEMMP
jgi:hypothetical protein